jgi:hypothetical protein
MNTKLIKLMFVISLIGFFSSIFLVLSELKNSGYCPKLLDIPACYIVLICFSFVILSNFTSNSTLEYILFICGAATGFFLAIWFSYRHINNIQDCPGFFKNSTMLYLIFNFFNNNNIKNHL